jgi:hypothetical protein
MWGYWSAAQRRKSRAAILLALAGVLFATTEALADLKLPPRPRGDPPMRIVRVMSADPACAPDCPEWISAEGRIMPGVAKAFARAIADLDGRRLPVLVSSHGGSVSDAVAMGILIRQRGLAVAVARTIIANCPDRAPACPNARGQAIAGGAFCASACPLILAGGVERLVGPAPLVGVHQITAVTKEVEGAARLTRIEKVYEPAVPDAAIERYWTAMGIGDPVMTLLRKTPAASIRWLSLPEIRASHLATLALDPAQPILETGANGLNGRAFDGEAPSLVTARGAAPLSPASGGTLEGTFVYRLGGGALEVTVAARGVGAKALPGWTVKFGDGKPLDAKVDGGGLARATLSRESFCAFARRGKLAATPTAASSGAEPQEAVAFDLSAMDGGSALIDEACPSSDQDASPPKN